MYGEYLTHDEQIEVLVKEIETLRELVVPSRILRCDVCGNKQVMHIEADDEKIIIRKAESKCVFCNSVQNLSSFKDKYICKECLDSIKH